VTVKYVVLQESGTRDLLLGVGTTAVTGDRPIARSLPT